MAKVTTFSRKFPSYHIRKGEPTYFVEKFLNTLGIDYRKSSYLEFLYEANKNKILEGKLSLGQLSDFYETLFDITDVKNHTMRSGNRYKVGESFSPRVWSEAPYYSPQIIFAPDTKIKEIYTCIFKPSHRFISINNRLTIPELLDMILNILSKNDGLSLSDFKSWFNKDFNGQIICWEEVNYEL